MSGSGTRRWSVRGFMSLVSIVLVSTVALAIAAVGFALNDLNRSRTHLLDEISPIVLGVRTMSTALVEQETGIRGFALTGRTEFLEPYNRGRQQAEQARSALASAAGAVPTAAEALAAVDTAVVAWQTEYAAPVVTAVRADGEIPSVDEGKARFDAVRASLNDASTRLEGQRILARTELNDSISRLGWIAVITLALLLTVVLLVLTGLRRAVVTPLSSLTAQVRRVARGDFTHEVAARGPAEVVTLAHDVDTMRDRIVEELEQAKERNAALDQASADLRRSNAELEQFAYVASHDLQEPLRKVASFCQLLERRYKDQLDEKAHQYIDFAVDGARRMQKLINDLLSFSRVGRNTDAHQDVQTADLVTAAVRNLSDTIADNQADVEVGDLPVVHGEPTLLTAVFQNLISNAVKFRGEVPPRIEVTAERTDRTWTFSVSDNGIGIDPQFADQVFIIFQRLHGKDAYPGTGIGLALCRKIVEFHGGTIWLDTDTPEGTTFRFTLPAVAPEPAE
jgi:signal transduction histidine kinase